MGKKAQSGLEYLVTYGWALFLIATIIGALVFLTGTPEASNMSSSDTGFLVKGTQYLNGSVKIKLQNITGGEIKIISLAGSEYYDCRLNGEYITGAGVKIRPGGEILVECGAEAAETDSAEIKYIDYSGLAKTAAITGKVGKEAAKTIGACPYTITQPGAYTLSGNLTAEYEDCITIRADNVTLNCRNKEITGNLFRTGILSENRSNNRVVNCKITGFAYGINFFSGTGNLIEGSKANGNWAAGIVLGGGGALVKNNEVSNNNGSGMNIGSGSPSGSHEITGNTINNNGGSGIDVMSGSQAIKNNTVNGNSNTGIYSPAIGNVIEGNIVNGNGYAGIIVGGNSTVSNNTACNDDPGVFQNIYCPGGLMAGTGNISDKFDCLGVEIQNLC